MSHVLRSLALAAVVLATVCASTPSAWACGGFFSPETTATSALAEISDQRVLFMTTGDGTVRQFAQVAYTGSPESFGWIYPFPALPSVLEAPGGVLDDLERESVPTFEITVPAYDDGGGSSGGCGCGSDAAMDGGVGGDYRNTVRPPVTVWGSGTVGSFEYATITATTTADLTTWLTENGFVAPQGADAVLQHYIDMGWFFVAMKVSPDPDGAATATIEFDYQATTLAYPLRMSSIGASAARPQTITLYVIGPKRAEVTGTFATVELDRGAVRATGPESTNYQSVFAAGLAAAAGRAFVVEHAGTLANLPQLGIDEFSEPLTLTRLRTELSAAELDQDVEIGWAATDATVSSTFVLTYEQSGGGAGSPAYGTLVVFVLVGLGLARRRR